MRWLVLLAALGLASSPGVAQERARIAEGRVLRATETGEPAPVSGQWVVLHRVGSDRAAPLDSVRSGRDGRFRFRYEMTGAPDALYFVSAMYGGIAYFSPPLRSAVVRGGDADVLVYETTTDTSSLRVQGRHIVVSQARGPRREIAEIFEIENQSPRTITARDSVPLWTTALPEAAENAAVAPGDVTASAVRFVPGRAELYAPVSPGVRQLVITYQLPGDAFPVAFPLQRPTSVLELLLEDPRGSVAGVAVREVDPATIEGRTFRRMLAQDLPANAVVSIDMPAPPGQGRNVIGVVIGTIAGLMLVGLVTWLARRRHARAGAATPTATSPATDVDRLIAELAALDARHESIGARTPEVDAQYERERAALKAAIERALAGRTRAP